MEKYIKLLKKFPQKRIAVGVLLFNKKGEVLILKPGYKDGWTLPGGVVEKGESLIDAALRETKEELGIKVKILKCLAVDFTKKQLANYADESLQILFLGDTLSDRGVNKIKIDNKEIVDFKFVEMKIALKLLNKYLSKRLNNFKGDYREFIFLENGKRIF